MINKAIAEGPVSVIIRCFNEEKHIGNLLQALQEQTLRSLDVIVVDSGSTDGTLSIVNNFSARIITIKPEDFSFGYSLNEGCKVARGEFFVIASAHVIPVDETWLEELIKPLRDPAVAVAYGRQLGNYLTKFSEHQVFSQQFPKESNFKQTSPFCNNANAAIRRSVWERHHYDESLTGLEDVEMGKWVLNNGFVLAYNVTASVIHIHEETPKKIFNRYKREAIALKRIFPDSHMKLNEFLSLLARSIFSDQMRALKSGKIFRCFFEIFVFRSMQYWGTYTGINSRSELTHEMMIRFYYPRNLEKLEKIKAKLTNKRANNNV
ncbi:MAG: glycosyltransferase [Bacteroidota bacterium]